MPGPRIEPGPAAPGAWSQPLGRQGCPSISGTDTQICYCLNSAPNFRESRVRGNAEWTVVWEVPDAEAVGRPSHGGCFWATGPHLPPESHHLDSGRALCKPSKNNTPQVKYLKGEGGGGDTAWGVNPFGKQRQPSLDELVD